MTSTSYFNLRQYTDPETGLIYLRARYYDPGTGQFLTRDPAVLSTRDSYGYAARSPLNLTDPSGLQVDRNKCIKDGAYRLYNYDDCKAVRVDGATSAQEDPKPSHNASQPCDPPTGSPRAPGVAGTPDADPFIGPLPENAYDFNKFFIWTTATFFLGPWELTPIGLAIDGLFTAFAHTVPCCQPGFQGYTGSERYVSPEGVPEWPPRSG